MAVHVQEIDDDIFTVTEVLSAGECQELIELAESLGFQPASVRTSDGPKMMTTVRNNDRVVHVDDQLANLLWHRIHHVLPVLDGAHACGVDCQLRFYRYVPGQRFNRHKDGFTTDSHGHQSKLSFLIYLNEDCDGGATTFFLGYQVVNEQRVKQEHVIRPTLGSALLFRHERWHEGTPVLSGRKYVLRTDVFYSSSADK